MHLFVTQEVGLDNKDFIKTCNVHKGCQLFLISQSARRSGLFVIELPYSGLLKPTHLIEKLITKSTYRAKLHVLASLCCIFSWIMAIIHDIFSGKSYIRLLFIEMIFNSNWKQSLYCMCESRLDQPVLSNKGNFLA